MRCIGCGGPDVEAGATCPTCGTLAVAPEGLESLLAMEAEAIEILDDEPAPGTFTPLVVQPATELVDHDTARPGAPGEPALEPDARWDAPTGSPVEEHAEHWAPAPSPAPSGAAPEHHDVDLPRRTPLSATEAQWGPRPHPPAVLAPPPPLPLDAPAVPRVKRSTGTGLPAGLRATNPPAPPPAPRPTTVPTPPPAPSGTPAAVVPDRPVHPRVRRWFGRGAGEEPAGVTTPAPPEPEAVPPGPFAGAPEGLLDGVVPEPDGGDGVVDPAGVEGPLGRLSAGARRSALAPLGVVAALLEHGEQVEAIVQGELQHRPAVAVLTDRRVVVANDRRWRPDVRTFPLDPTLVVHGWQDERRATLVFVAGGTGTVLHAISDRPLARDLAQRIRARCAAPPAGPASSG